MSDVRGTVNFNQFHAESLSGAPSNPAVATARVKRASDIGLALVLLTFALPLLIVVSALIKVSSRGPVFTHHKRAGLGGLPINVLTFRIKTSRAAQADGAEAMTTLGRMLRSTGVDVLPQLINVLKGDMSMVGPAAHAFTIDRYYSSIIPQYSARTRVRPGFTGLAQVNGLSGDRCSIQGMSERVADDNAYIDYWTAGLDLRILLRAAIRTVYRPSSF